MKFAKEYDPRLPLLAGITAGAAAEKFISRGKFRRLNLSKMRN
jgi:hypothetical protein